MSIDIEDLLHRRSDLSTFVVHLTKDTPDGPSAKENLLSILGDPPTLRAGEPMGWAYKEAIAAGDAAMESQRVVCFTETPLEHLYAMFADIRRRKVKLRGYGIAFTKVTARKMGINPVWYIDKTWGRSWELGLALDDLRSAAIADGFTGASAKLLPFIEPMFDWRNVPDKTQVKEFWWEREWRHRGDLTFSPTDVALVIAPAADHAELEPIIGNRVVDGTWGLERVIAKLAGVPPSEQATPVAAR